MEPAMHNDPQARQDGTARRRRRLDVAVGYAILLAFAACFIAAVSFAPSDTGGTASDAAPAADTMVAASNG
jgi:ferric-dicitrate binding protein FerR (iron transport regulator)